MTASDSAESPRSAGLRGNRNWLLLWIGQSVSAVGDMVFYITALLWIATVIAKGEPWAPSAASGALVAASVPALVVGPFAGVFIDRWDRRRTMLAADAARCVLVASLLILPGLHRAFPVGAQLALLYAVIAACSCFDQFFTPSRLAILGSIVPEDLQPAASGRLSASFAFAQVIGPPLAAPLLFTVGVQWALIVNAASFAVSFLCVRAMTVTVPAPDDSVSSASERPGFWAEFRHGVSFYARSKVLVALGIGLAIALMGNGAINSLAAFFVPRNLHVSASWLGFVVGAVGVGAVIGSALTGWLSRRLAIGRQFCLALLGAGVFLIAFARSGELWLAVGLAFCLGLFSGLLNSTISPIMLRASPPELIGRVSAVLSPVLELSSMAGMVLAGTLASTVLVGFHGRLGGISYGPYDTVLASGGLLFVIGGIAAFPAMRLVGREHAAGAADHTQIIEPPGSAADAQA